MKKHLNIGMVGFGAMGKTHAYSIASLPYFYSPLPFVASVRGICTTSQEKSERICDELGFARAYTDAYEMIADPAVYLSVFGIDGNQCRLRSDSVIRRAREI